MILKDTTLVLDARNLSGYSNEVSLDFTRTELDSTTFQSGDAKTKKAGLSDVSVTAAGFWSIEVDDDIEALDGTTGRLIVATDKAIGSPAWLVDAKCISYGIGGAVDALLPWNATFNNAVRSGARRGTILHDPTNLVEATGASTGVQLSALGASDSIVFRVHVFSVEGVSPEIELEFQSSSTNGWSSPTVEDTAVFEPGDVTEVTINGAITNTWWRVNVSDLTGDALFIVTAEIVS